MKNLHVFLKLLLCIFLVECHSNRIDKNINDFTGGKYSVEIRGLSDTNRNIIVVDTIDFEIISQNDTSITLKTLKYDYCDETNETDVFLPPKFKLTVDKTTNKVINAEIEFYFNLGEEHFVIANAFEETINKLQNHSVNNEYLIYPFWGENYTYEQWNNGMLVTLTTAIISSILEKSGSKIQRKSTRISNYLDWDINDIALVGVKNCKTNSKSLTKTIIKPNGHWEINEDVLSLFVYDKNTIQISLTPLLQEKK
jgi:hypothetical protein